MSKSNIFIIGPLGSGKTTIGRQLADTLSMEFIDSDEELENSLGVSLSWIYDVEGEEGLRSREEKVIKGVSQRSNVVLATGGNAIISKENRKILASRGFVVYLNTSIDKQLHRTRHDKGGRPLLEKSSNRQALLLSMMKEHDALYRSIADMTILSGECSMSLTVKEIIKAISVEV
ncbi:Shikimate kinase 1 [Piscirickettsia salmonis]|uniref:shikimate kinase AroK n=1 Tax=Piscirickettsia salmonis TaxID=1238 RepID=UPI0020070357|nr:Shikimate kinase 1 [Piscirickettsia salmonis]QGP60066.1 Shikimate kinase 1 [Piscirickettsia salmonis]QGP63613.1 Shikimate kinase 1 [Piscirickettsia salmonis]